MPKKTLPGTQDADALMTDPKIKDKKVMTVTMKDCRWIHIENYEYIVDFTEKCVKIMGKTQMICVEGGHLTIIYFTEDDILISGRIMSVKYIR